MKIENEQAMLELGRKLGRELKVPSVIELVGDVGAGKTTLVRGMAEGLGVKEVVTSPSFTISKRYGFEREDGVKGELIHYDFYRLGDAGIMANELAETLVKPDGVIVVEWGETVADLLPNERKKIVIQMAKDGGRLVQLEG